MVCHYCNKEFSGRKRKYCCDDCRREDVRRSYYLSMDRQVPNGSIKRDLKGSLRKCVKCSRYFEPKFRNHKFCSHECAISFISECRKKQHVTPETIKCRTCNIEKPYTEFSKNNKLITDRSYECRECRNKRVRLTRKTNGYEVKRRIYEAERVNIDPKFRLNRSMRTGIHHSLKCLNGKNGKNGRKWEDLLGYTVDQLKRHLERKFKPGMNWDNYGQVWHIDHIIPKSVFNFSEVGHLDFKRCWALKNLQPMFALENICKGNSISKPFQPCLALRSAKG